MESVHLQFASSNSTSTFTFVGSQGIGGSFDYYDAPSANTSYTLNPTLHRGRYFKYRIILNSDAGQSVSPIVSDVIVNWSP